MTEDRMLKLFHRVDLDPETRKKTEDVRALYIDLATMVVAMVPQGPERTVALRHLLDSKDCAIRGMIFDRPPPPPKL